MKLLLIEDVPPLAALTREALQGEGFTVDLAASVEQAVETLAVAPPDVIVLDLGLPDGDGLDLLHRLRAGGSTVPVLVVTARAGLNDRIEGLDRGADDYIVKRLPRRRSRRGAGPCCVAPVGLLGRRIQLGTLTFDTASRSVFVADQLVALARGRWMCWKCCCASSARPCRAASSRMRSMRWMRRGAECARSLDFTPAPPAWRGRGECRDSHTFAALVI